LRSRLRFESASALRQALLNNMAPRTKGDSKRSRPRLRSRRLTTSSPPAARYAAPALDKGLDIIELLSKQQDGLTRPEIAEQLQRSVGEIFRMIECLTRRSYLVQHEDTFSLGMKLFELAHEFPPMSRLLKEALPRMEALAKVVDQSCHLSVLSGARQLVVAQVDSPGGVGFGVKLGATLDLVKSASGRVLLAFHDEQTARQLIALAEPDLKVAATRSIVATLREVAVAGFAFSPSRQFSGVEAISYPILDLHRRAIAALTVPYVARLDDNTRMTASATQSALAEVAAALNHALGTSAAMGPSTSQ
jgi:DNA-binding IclR family transcriptional regulator